MHKRRIEQLRATLLKCRGAAAEPRAAAYFLAKRQEGICKPFSAKGYNYLPPPHETPWRVVLVRLVRFCEGRGGGVGTPGGGSAPPTP